MAKELRFSANINTFNACADRYVLSGYGERLTSEELIQAATRVEGLTGVELVGMWHVNDDNLEQVHRQVRDAGFEVTCVIPDIWASSKWGWGSFSSNDPQIRRDAIHEVKKSMEWASQMDCEVVDLWFGQDGFDYPLQSDSPTAWDRIIEGMREMLNVYDRPLCLQIIKPKMGMTPEETAAQVYQSALGGADLCKDDEMCSELENCSFDARLEAVLKALARAERETGEKTIYLASITDESSRVHEKARRAVKAGATGLLLAYSAGLSTLKDLADDPEINVPIMLHPSHMLGMIETFSWVALSKLCRLSGADLMLSPSLWSSLQTCSIEEELRTSQTLRAPFYNIRRTWPMPSAGMYPGLAEALIQEHGIDFIVPAGGGMLGHPMGYKQGAMAWRQAFDAVLSGMSLQEAARKYPEFRAAAELWGIRERPKTPWGYHSPGFHPKFANKNL